jgi:hypothetical protein
MSSVRNISLYIPRVFSSFSKKYIAEAFEKVFIGKVSKIDLVPRMCGVNVYNSAYIHFEYWYDNVAAINFQERVLNPNLEARLVYDDPWYWIVLENKAKRYIPGERKSRIDIGDLNEKKETSNVLCESKDVVIEKEPNYNIYVDGRYVKELERINYESISYINYLQTQIQELKLDQALVNLPV